MKSKHCFVLPLTSCYDYCSTKSQSYVNACSASTIITCIRICETSITLRQSRRRQLLMAVLCVWSLICIWFQLCLFSKLVSLCFCIAILIFPFHDSIMARKWFEVSPLDLTHINGPPMARRRWRLNSVDWVPSISLVITHLSFTEWMMSEAAWPD